MQVAEESSSRISSKGNDSYLKQTKTNRQTKKFSVNISQLIHKNDQGQDGERCSISSGVDWPIPALSTHLPPATHL